MSSEILGEQQTYILSLLGNCYMNFSNEFDLSYVIPLKDINYTGHLNWPPIITVDVDNEDGMI